MQWWLHAAMPHKGLHASPGLRLHQLTCAHVPAGFNASAPMHASAAARHDVTTTLGTYLLDEAATGQEAGEADDAGLAPSQQAYTTHSAAALEAEITPSPYGRSWAEAKQPGGSSSGGERKPQRGPSTIHRGAESSIRGARGSARG